MASIEKALQIAARAHEGQTDKNGQPYILHPLRVMNAVEDEAAKIVAALHDVIEDSSVTVEDLRQEGFEVGVLAALECLTHRKGESYSDYVARCKCNVIARQVKLADLEDNARPSRALLRPRPDRARYCPPAEVFSGLQVPDRHAKRGAIPGGDGGSGLIRGCNGWKIFPRC